MLVANGPVLHLATALRRRHHPLPPPPHLRPSSRPRPALVGQPRLPPGRHARHAKMATGPRTRRTEEKGPPWRNRRVQQAAGQPHRAGGPLSAARPDVAPPPHAAWAVLLRRRRLPHPTAARPTPDRRPSPGLAPRPLGAQRSASSRRVA